jgi:hypothetical protein
MASEWGREQYFFASFDSSNWAIVCWRYETGRCSRRGDDVVRRAPVIAIVIAYIREVRIRE